MIDHNDAALIVRAQRHDRDAIGQLYDLHRDSIFRYLWLHLDDVHLAEDLTGDVFLRMLDALPRYRVGHTPFRAWLYRIAHNLTIDHFRKIRQRTSVPLEAADDRDSGDDLSVTIEHTVLTDQLRTALTYLDATQREVVTLRFLLGLSLEETALTLGKTESAIKALQHRGLISLRRMLHPAKELLSS